ncbi:hypothetical protein IQ07DRAFT_48331 [Pyrenochaeta sp. DS3sAY3a]|nr:hypothetical protein IQ07DRAFT_48331 [Pyrenochaeta sp. DS3sAY3a]
MWVGEELALRGCCYCCCMRVRPASRGCCEGQAARHERQAGHSHHSERFRAPGRRGYVGMACSSAVLLGAGLLSLFYCTVEVGLPEWSGQLSSITSIQVSSVQVCSVNLP